MIDIIQNLRQRFMTAPNRGCGQRKGRQSLPQNSLRIDVTAVKSIVVGARNGRPVPLQTVVCIYLHRGSIMIETDSSIVRLAIDVELKDVRDLLKFGIGNTRNDPVIGHPASSTGRGGTKLFMELISIQWNFVQLHNLVECHADVAWFQRMSDARFIEIIGKYVKSTVSKIWGRG